MRANSKSEIQLLHEINENLRKLLATTVIQGKTNAERVALLAKQGFTNDEISDITGIPRGTVSVARAKLKK